MAELESIVQPLLVWYTENKRDLPWRKDTDPYHVWISEIMLQQTRVEAVKGYYLRFMDMIPTLQDLAIIDDEKLLKLWEGLGYYNRARNLKKAAGIVVSNFGGSMPTTYDSLLTLPGIGPYTAGAISSICFDEKVTAVDGNVLRVVMRYLNCEDNIDLPQTKKKVTSLLEEVLPNKTGDFNQSLMELGALICLPNGMPKCMDCPLNKRCLSVQHNTQLELPKRSLKRKRKIEQKTVFIFVNNHEVAIQKRDAQGLLANFYEFPSVDKHLSLKQLNHYLKDEHIDALRIFDIGIKKHIFTHIEWHMQGYFITTTEQFPPYIWTSNRSLIEDYPIPNAYSYFKKILEEKGY